VRKSCPGVRRLGSVNVGSLPEPVNPTLVLASREGGCGLLEIGSVEAPLTIPQRGSQTYRLANNCGGERLFMAETFVQTASALQADDCRKLIADRMHSEAAPRSKALSSIKRGSPARFFCGWKGKHRLVRPASRARLSLRRRPAALQHLGAPPILASGSSLK
jgi:hypothetical protein